MAVEITNEQNRLIIKDKINNLIVKAYNLCVAEHDFKFQPAVDLIITDNEKIKLLNNKYMKKDKPTDVLSFPLSGFENGKIKGKSYKNELKHEIIDNKLFIGDIVISAEKAEKQAGQYGHSLEREFVFLFIHGMLHLLGYDHKNKEQKELMFKMQDNILDKLELKRESL